MMLTMNSEISDYGSWETGSYVYEEDEFDDPEDEEDDEYETDDDPQGDVQANGDDQENGENGADAAEEVGYSDDETFARALQEAEAREMADRLSALTGLANREYTVIDITLNFSLMCIGFGIMLNCYLIAGVEVLEDDTSEVGSLHF